MNERLPAGTRIGAVHLTVAHLDAAVAFYTGRLGLVVQARAPGLARLGASGGDLLVLWERPGAQPSRGTTGLYHFAVLVPSRRELAVALSRLVASRTVLQGASDHGVSEALYLGDPEDNGIEIYRDRPNAEWPRSDGRLAMISEPLDLDGVLRELPPTEAQPIERPVAAGTTIGHVHLHVADLDAAMRFYVDLLGFDLTQRYGRSAMFVAAGGYHHHVGLNTWRGQGAPPPPPGAAGLREFEVVVPGRNDVDRAASGLRSAGIEVESDEGSILVRDPSQNTLRLRAEQASPRD